MRRQTAGIDAAAGVEAAMPSAGQPSRELSDAADMSVVAETIRRRSEHLARDVFNTTRAFVTLATFCNRVHASKPAYFLMHTLTLARTLQDVNSTYPLIALVSDQEDCDLLREYEGRVIKELNMAFLRVPSRYFRPEALPEPENINWRYTYPKSYVWAMEGFERLVYLDADVMVLRNSDDLFDLPETERLYMSTNQQACNKMPFEANDLGGASNLMILSPQKTDFSALLEKFRKVRQRRLVEEGEADDQSIIGEYFKEVGRLTRLPPADMLFTECLRLFNCEVGAVRALHFGNAGRLVLDQGKMPLTLDLDRRWKPVFHKWADFCRSDVVQTACNEHCKGLCLSRVRTWACMHC